MLKLLFLWTASVFSYYSLFKGAVFAGSRKFIHRQFFSTWKKKYNPQEIAGAVELALVATSHVFFVLCLLAILKISFSYLGFSNFRFYDLIYGILLGIGEMSFSSLVCLAVIKGLQKIIPDRVPQNSSEWLVIARGGWVRHHIQSFEIFPIFIAFFILLLQVGSEEVIFRCIIPHSLKAYGPLYSYGIATLLFIWMQAFHTPNWKTAIFPMIGALIMGILHSYLFYSVPRMFPLIIAHITFFLMSLI